MAAQARSAPADQTRPKADPIAQPSRSPNPPSTPASKAKAKPATKIKVKAKPVTETKPKPKPAVTKSQAKPAPRPTPNPAVTPSKPRLEISLSSGLRLAFHGSLELEFVDVEGQGGFSHQDLTTLKVNNRSPHLKLDKAVLEPRLLYKNWFVGVFQIRGNSSKVYIDRAHVTFHIRRAFTKILVGKDRPFVYPGRVTEGYPLIGTQYWKGRTPQIAVQTAIPLGPVTLRFGAMFGSKRKLGTDDIAEDDSFKMMVYDDYRAESGNTFEGGGKIGVDLYGFSLLGYGFGSRLYDNEDLRYITDYELPRAITAGGFTTDELSNDLSYWYGGRVGFNRWGVGVRGEYIRSRDGVVRREGFYVQASYQLALSRWVGAGHWASKLKFLLLGRYGQSALTNIPEQRDESVSWNRQMLTAAFITSWADFLFFKVEYYILMEDTGGLGVDADIADNQLLFQLNLEF